MILNVRVHVDKETLIWAAAYMLAHKRAIPYLMKKDVLEFLRAQISQFGTDEYTLKGYNWRTDFAEHIPTATAWVEKRFSEVTE